MQRVLKFFIIIPFLTLFLSGCTEGSNQYIAADGTIIFQQELNLEKSIKDRLATIDNELEVAELKKNISQIEAGKWLGYELCDDLLKEAEINENIIYIGCQPQMYGLKAISYLNSTSVSPDTNPNNYKFDLSAFIQQVMTNINNEDPEELLANLDLNTTFKLSFEAEVISSNIGTFNTNQLNLSTSDLKQILKGNDYYVIARKKVGSNPTPKKYARITINLDGSGYQEVVLADLSNLAPTKEWGESSVSLKEIFCAQKSPATCYQQDNVLFEKKAFASASLIPQDKGDNKQYQIIELLELKSLNESELRDWSLENSNLYFADTTLILPGEIVRADYGVIDNNQLSLKKEEIEKLAYDSIVLVKPATGSVVTEELKRNILSIKGPMLKQLMGKIILQVEARGEAYYLNPSNQSIYYLGRPNDAFKIMREQGMGITNENLAKIPVAISNLKGLDSDGDSLSDDFELALGLDPFNRDSDGDGYPDDLELANNYNPLGKGSLQLDAKFSDLQAGKIFIQIESRGEAWYISPTDNRRYYLGKPDDAYAVMRSLGLGISNENLAKIMQPN